MTPLAALFRRSATDPRADGPLLAAFADHRDEPAFAELVRRHGPLVWGACRRALPDPADAEDAFQATFLVLVRRARRLTGAATVGPWLLKVAALTARNARRKNARRLARTAPLSDVPDPRPAPVDIDGVLLGLPERCRAAVLLTHLEGLTHREAAARLGCAEGTVSSLVSRGLTRLRARLGAAAGAGLLGVAVPAALADAAVRSATAVQLASASASSLAREVLRMFWVRKATAAGFATVVLLAAGFGAGMAVREAPAVGQDKEAPAVKQPDAPPARQDVAAYVVFTIRGIAPGNNRVGAPEPFTLTEFDAKGKCLWSVIPGRDQAEKWNSTVKLIELDQEAIIGGARAYLTRVRKDATAPRDLRVVIENEAQLGGFTMAGLAICRDAGFDTIKLTGYLANGGGFIPQLKVGPNGEAEGYKRYKGERVELKKLIADYGQTLRTF
ncbi:MAG TPA: sigma-70 family RNA polymerase sigma factor [Urbifossiella sp.]|nr:sigma-70 family RNA polymerase sigma factor [Urbifossiella sp.]